MIERFISSKLLIKEHVQKVAKLYYIDF